MGKQQLMESANRRETGSGPCVTGIRETARRGRPFRPGQSGNPGGRPKAIAEVRELARSLTALAVQTLVSIMEHGDKDAARVAAAQAILDGGWGKAVQALDMTGHYKTPMTPARKRRAGQHGSAVGPRHARSPLHRRRPSRHRGGHDVELFC